MANSPRSANGDDADPSAPAKQLQVVGIGASAGGLAALRDFFSHVPEDSGLSFVVVVHLSPEHESHLAELLQPHVRMPIQQVMKTTRLEPNQVYVIPPNANLDTIDTHLRLTELEKNRHERAPIDHFFRTLAKTHDGASIGVILTGTGSDGTLGLRDIKQKGGLTVVQDPAEAEYDGMPQSAIATGLVDLVAPLAAIPKAILDFTRTEPKLPIVKDDSDLEAEQRRILLKLFAQLRARTGRDFSRYKRSTLMRRIQRRMQLRRMEEFAAYSELLRDNPDEVWLLADDLLVTVTNFFRDREVFELLERQVIPQVFEHRSADNGIRVWSVGCATGEEAYSLAILLLEEAARRDDEFSIQVFASDLHERSLEKAREGFYPGDIETDITPERLARYFEKENGGYRIRKEVRELVLFAPHNLMGDPPFSRLDLISCRNLMIYLERGVQQEVIELFHYALNPEGVLLLGTAESLDDSDLFRMEDKKFCLFRKRNTPSPEPRLPVFPLVRTSRHRELPVTTSVDAPPHGMLHQQLVEQFAPPSVLVSSDDRVVHVSIRAGRYLTVPGGEVTSNVYMLVREELRVELRAACHEARSKRQTVTTEPIELRLDGTAHSVSLHVIPATQTAKDGYLLVVFAEPSANAALPLRPEPSGESLSTSENRSSRDSDSMRTQLSLSRQRLQGIIEEYETGREELRASNEELQSSNEELRSTLEELETSKEELQSVNEELQTTNQENRHKVAELAQLSSDLQNLMAATDIATLFLDRELRILRFTPQIGELFNVRVTDRGRPLSDLTHRLGYNELLEDARNVLGRLVPIAREVQDDGGKWYLTRVLPYRSTVDRIEGVVITFVDISNRIAAEASLRKSEQQFRALIDASAQMVWTTAMDGRMVEDSPSWRDFTGQTYEQWKGWGWLSTIHPDDRAQVETEWRKSLQEQTSFVGEYRFYHAPTAEFRWTMVRAVPLKSEDNSISGWVGMNIDIDERKRAEQSLIESDRRKSEFLATLAHELRNPLAPIRTGLENLRLTANDPEVVADTIAIVDRQTKQLVILVDELLDVSRISRGTLTLRKRVTSLEPIVELALDAAKPPIERGRQELRIDLPPQPVALFADPSRVAQILANLLINAAKFTPAGGHIWLMARVDGKDLHLSVRDTGSGISSDDLKTIFGMFFQAHNVTGSQGLGIGLTLTKQLVELHGGRINVLSDGPGRGSDFQVVLPVVTDAPLEELPVPERSAPPARRLRVLVVDDNEDAAVMLSKTIALLGHDVRTAGNGAEAIEIAKTYDPELVLMDLGMPEMDGYQAAKHIRSQSWGQRMTLVALTGWGQEEDRHRTQEAGFDRHLVKPIDHHELKELFEAVLANR